MDQSEPARSRRTTAIIAAAGLACLAIAIPVSGAFADGDGSGNNTTGTAPAQDYGPAAYGQQRAQIDTYNTRTRTAGRPDRIVSRVEGVKPRAEGQARGKVKTIFGGAAAIEKSR